jgi:site-specific DNA recombinase
MQVAAYARVSTQRQVQARTTDQQVERLRAHAAAEGWTLVPEQIFRDDGYSGASLRRPGLDRLRDAAAGARLDRILITAPDRLARNYVHQVLLVEELQKHGAVVDFLDRPMSRDPHDQLLLQIRGAVAEYERTLITERMRRGRLRKLHAGLLLPWTRPPYGYRLDPERPRDPTGVRLDEAEATVVRDLFARFADEGMAVTALVQHLHRLGIPSPRGHRNWSRPALRNVLSNPIYLGQVIANRLRMPPAERRRSALLPVGRGQGGRRLTDPADWIAVAPVPAIIGQEQFDRAQEWLSYIAPALFVLKRSGKSQLPGHEARGHAQAVGRGPRGAPAAGHRTAPARDGLPGDCRSGRTEPDRGVQHLPAL